VIFIYLPHPYVTRPEMYAPLGVMILASILRNHNIDASIKNYSHFSFEEAIEDLPKKDVYGITCTSLELPDANKFSKLIKSKFPKSKVVLGGPGTLTPENVDWSSVDSVVYGEAELEIIKIYYDLKNGIYEKEYIPKFIKNLDDLPFPYRTDESIGCNIFSFNTNDNRSSVIMTGRGCPYNCCYCASKKLNKGTIRYRSIDNVIEEIREVKERFNVRQFRILDEMLNANKSRLYEFCDKVKDLDISWRLPLRVKPLDLDILKAMKRAGCKEVSFGIESFDDNVLEILNKKTTSNQNALALFLTKEVGLVTRVFLLLRTPGQTQVTMKINMKYLNIVPYDVVTCSTLVPFPGTDLWYHPEKYNIEILTKDLSLYNIWSYGPEGERDWPDIIKPLDRSLKEFNEEANEMKRYLKLTGKWNRG